MKTGVFYLNSSGSKWVILVNGKREKIELITKGGKKITRTVKYYSGLIENFGSAHIRYKGKEIDVFSDTVLED